MNHHTVNWQVGHLNKPVFVFVRKRRPGIYLDSLGSGNTFPTLRNAFGDGGMFMAGEAEEDEPLAVELPRRVFQQRHPPPVVFDQIVVGGKNVGDALLFGEGRIRNFYLGELFLWKMFDRRPSKKRIERATPA